MSNWISVNDRLPIFDQEVLLTDGKCRTVGIYLGESINHADVFFPEGFYSEGAGSYYSDITHWMPLPKLPKADTEG